MAKVELKGDWNLLVKDMKRYPSKLESLSAYEFGEMTNRIARYWTKQYNLGMSKHPSLAKARLSKRTQGRTYNNYVTIPDKAVYFDLGGGKGDKGHFVSLNNNPSLKRWIRQRWVYIPKVGWKTTQPDTRLSRVSGTAATPKGQVFVRSHYAKTGESIIENAHKATAEQARQEFGQVLPRLAKKLRSNLFTRDVYKLKININI